jgi:hypothetical protein
MAGLAIRSRLPAQQSMCRKTAVGVSVPYDLVAIPQEHMAQAIEKAVDLHREIARRGLQLNPVKGRDAALHDALASALGVPARGFTKALKANDVSAASYLRAFVKLAEPFSRMFADIWTFLAAHCAPNAGESVRIQFGFSGQDEEVDWNQFREMVRSAHKVLAATAVDLWPIEELWELRRILGDPHFIDGPIRLSYWPGDALQIPQVPIVLEVDRVGHLISSVLQAAIDAIHVSYQSNAREERQAKIRSGLGLDEPSDPSEHEQVLNYANPLTDLAPAWSPLLSAWHQIPLNQRIAAFEHYTTATLPKLRREEQKRTVVLWSALDVLNLPFWKDRWRTYEVWAAIKGIEALRDYAPRMERRDGRIAFDTSNGALIATLQSSEPIYAFTQAQTRVTLPGSKRKAIKPDMRLATDMPATNRGTIAAIEFKQRKALSQVHAIEVMTAYGAGTKTGKNVVMVNYDAIWFDASQAPGVLIGDMRPDCPSNVAAYQDAVRACLSNSRMAPARRDVCLLLDVSGSMAGTYSAPAFRTAINRIASDARVRIYRFNDGLVTGGDLPSDFVGAVKGGTQLGAALTALIALPEEPIPKRLLVVTDGGHDHPNDLLSRFGDAKECMPADLLDHSDWLLGD